MSVMNRFALNPRIVSAALLLLLLLQNDKLPSVWDQGQTDRVIMNAIDCCPLLRICKLRILMKQVPAYDQQLFTSCVKKAGPQHNLTRNGCHEMFGHFT